MLVELSVMEQRYHAVMEVVSGAPVRCGRSLDDAEPEMGDTRSLDHAHAVQLDGLGTHPVEQADSVAKQHGNQVKLQLVKQPGRDELPHDVRAAPQQYITVTCRCLRLGQGLFDAIGDEGVGRSSLHDQGLAGMVGDDEDRHAKGRVVPPRHHPVVEHASAHHRSADVPAGCAKDLSMGASKVAALTPVPQTGHPLVKPITPLAQRIARTIVWPGGKPIQRH
jgi:hypothetical protein